MIKKGEYMLNKKIISIVLGIMCFALTLGICVQTRTVKNSNSTVSNNYEENNLRAEVLKYKEKYDSSMSSPLSYLFFEAKTENSFKFWGAL